MIIINDQAISVRHEYHFNDIDWNAAQQSDPSLRQYLLVKAETDLCEAQGIECLGFAFVPPSGGNLNRWATHKGTRQMPGQQLFKQLQHVFYVDFYFANARDASLFKLFTQ